MAIKFIDCRWAYGGVRRLDTITGRSSRSREFTWGQCPDSGWAIRLGFKWVYYYEHNRQWFFQHKKRRIKNDSEHEFFVKQVSNRRRQLIIKHQGQITFEMIYKFKGYWVSKLDPTYDGIDAESDDPFLNFVDLDAK